MNKACFIRLLGGLNLVVGGRSVDRFRTYKTGALLGYLAYHLQRTHLREVLAELFWPDTRTDAARLSLRVALNALRRQLEPPGILPGTILLTTQNSIRLNHEQVDTDVAEFETLLDAATKTADEEDRLAAWTASIALYRGDLLSGYYEDWIVPERERIAIRRLEALSQLSQGLQKAGGILCAIEYGQKAIAAAPLDEGLRRAIMQMYADAGRPADALRQYDMLERLLQAEWGERPSPEVRRLADAIRSQMNKLGEVKQEMPAALEETGTFSARPSVPRLDLPPLHTRFFGREPELARLEAMLRTVSDATDNFGPEGNPALPPELSNLQSIPARLITLMGTGGVGKTRLAIETARRVANSFGGSVYFVPLADLDDPVQVPDAIADALKLPRVPSAEPLEQIIRALSTRASLLVLDNLEHLLAENQSRMEAADVRRKGVRALALTLLRRLKNLFLLVTSRQSLALAGEYRFHLHPLPFPGEIRHSNGRRAVVDGLVQENSPARALDCPSVQLFIDRAKSARSDFQCTARNLQPIASLCAKLEGLPLSLELAAAWSETLTPSQMLARLTRPHGALTSRRKDGPHRQDSLWTTIEWSYNLLPSELQQFFARLSVFRSGWTLEMAEEVCEEPRACSYLAELYARSIILADETDEAMRYRLLESLREYGDSQLEEVERRDLNLRLSRCILQLAEQAETELAGPEQQVWSRRLAVEQDNLRAALAWTLQAPQDSSEVVNKKNRLATPPGLNSIKEIGLRLAGALVTFWEISGQVVEGRRWLASALAQCEAGSARARARALYADAALAQTQGDDADAERQAKASLRLFESLKLVTGRADALLLLSNLAYRQGDTERAEGLLSDSLVFCRQSGYRRGLASALREQGRRKGFCGEYTEAEALLTESRALYEEIGDLRGVAGAGYEQAIIDGYRQDFPKALARYEEVLSLYRQLGDRIGMSWATFGIGYIARMRRDYALAASALEDHLLLQREILSKKGTAIALRNLGCLARDRGDYSRAASLLEEALAIFRESGEQQGVAETLGSLGIVAMFRADYASARAFHEACLRFRREKGYKQDIAESLFYLSRIASAENDLRLARAHIEESLALAREVGSRICIMNALMVLSEICRREQDYDSAVRLQREYLFRLQIVDGEWQCIEGIEAMAMAWQAQGRNQPAACLLGAVEAFDVRSGYRRLPYLQEFYDLALAAIRHSLEPVAFATDWEQGRGMTMEQAIEYAHSENFDA